MSHPFKPYEVDVLKLLLKGEFTERQLSTILEGASAPLVEYTNYGFYVSIQHPAIGKGCRVSAPRTDYIKREIPAARARDSYCSLEDDTLTLEIVPWDGVALPASFRESAIQLVLENPQDAP